MTDKNNDSTSVSLSSTPTSSLISVVMATYNQSALVGRAIDSILVQTLRDFEFIIVDDGSTDNTATVLKSYAAKDERIRIISQENQGMPRSRNKGVSEARGKYIAFMDSDDASASNRLEAQLKLLKSNPGYEACACYSHAIQNYKPKSMAGQEAKVGTKTLYNSLSIYESGALQGLLNPTTFISKSSFVAMGGYRTETTIIEDLDFTLRYSRKYKWIFMQDSCLYFYSFPSLVRVGLTNQDILTFAQRHIACYVSEWYRHNNLSDPVEEGKSLEDVISQVSALSWRQRHIIYKSMGHLVAEISVGRKISRRKAHWYLFRQLRYAYPLRLLLWLNEEFHNIIRSKLIPKLGFTRPLLVLLRIKKPLARQDR